MRTISFGFWYNSTVGATRLPRHLHHPAAGDLPVPTQSYSRFIPNSVLTEVLESSKLFSEVACESGVSLQELLDWFLSEPIRALVAKYREAQQLIAEARSSAYTPALLDQLHLLSKSGDDRVAIRATTTLARLVIRELPPKRAEPVLQGTARCLPKRPAAPFACEPGELELVSIRESGHDLSAPASPATADQTPSTIAPDATPQSQAARRQSPTPPPPQSRPAQAHPAPRDATPPLPSSIHSPSPPTQLQTPVPAHEPFPLPDQSLRAPAERTTPPPDACAA